MRVAEFLADVQQCLFSGVKFSVRVIGIFLQLLLLLITGNARRLLRIHDAFQFEKENQLNLCQWVVILVPCLKLRTYKICAQPIEY